MRGGLTTFDYIYSFLLFFGFDYKKYNMFFVSRASPRGARIKRKQQEQGMAQKSRFVAERCATGARVAYLLPKAIIQNASFVLFLSRPSAPDVGERVHIQGEAGTRANARESNKTFQNTINAGECARGGETRNCTCKP